MFIIFINALLISFIIIILTLLDYNREVQDKINYLKYNNKELRNDLIKLKDELNEEIKQVKDELKILKDQIKKNKAIYASYGKVNMKC